MASQIGLRNYAGRVCVIGPKADLDTAIDGAAPVTLTYGNMAGDRVWLKSRPVWSLATDSEQMTPYADQFAHEGVEIVACWIDTDRLDDAPLLAAHRQRKHEAQMTETVARERRIAATVPSCNNCGDCPQCC